MEKLKELFNSSNRFIGVYGSDKGYCSEIDHAIATKVGQVLYAIDPQQVIVTGSCSGLPALISQTFHDLNGWTIGISPGKNIDNHIQVYGNPVAPYRNIVFVNDCQDVEYPFGFRARRKLVMEYLDAAVIIKGGLGTFKEVLLLLHYFNIPIFLIKGVEGTSELVENLVKDMMAGRVTEENIVKYVVDSKTFAMDEELVSTKNEWFHTIMRGMKDNRMKWINDVSELQVLKEIKSLEKNASEFFSRIHHVINSEELDLAEKAM